MVFVQHVEDSVINVSVILKHVYLVKMDTNIIQIQRHVHNLVYLHKYHLSILIPLTKYVIHVIHHVNSAHHTLKTV